MLYAFHFYYAQNYEGTISMQAERYMYMYIDLTIFALYPQVHICSFHFLIVRLYNGVSIKTTQSCTCTMKEPSTFCQLKQTEVLQMPM